MNFTLTITGSAAALAHVLANMPDDATAGAQPQPAPFVPSAINSFTPPPIPQSQPATSDDDDGGAPNVNAPALDSTGLPWDARIHASTKGTNADGSWKKKKGASALVESVEAELRARMGNPAPAPQYPAPAPFPQAQPMQPQPMQPQPVPQFVPPVMQQQPAPVAQPVPQFIPPVMQQQPAPVAQPSPMQGAVDAAHGMTDYNGFMQHIATKFQERSADGTPVITPEILARITGTLSQVFQQPLTSITEITDKPHMIGYAIQLLQSEGRW